MQKPTGPYESRANEEQTLAGQIPGEQQAQKKEPVRIDYLTPVSEIKTPEIHIFKEKRRLYVIQGNVLVRDYPVGLGAIPYGDKERAEDGKTPEGDFLVCGKDPANRFRKSLAISYPGKKHADRAVFQGLLTPAEFREIVLAGDRRTAPPSGTKLGGKVQIHAGGAQRDWTDGSVALYDSDMEELYRIASMGTPVFIRP